MWVIWCSWDELVWEQFHFKNLKNLFWVIKNIFSHFSEIVDGNCKMTLGMIWTIILRFAIQDISVEGNVIGRHCENSINYVNFYHV